jgi:hypothetical protein
MATPHPYVCTLNFRTLNAVYNAQDCMVPGRGIPLATLRYYFELNEQLATDDAKTQEFLAGGLDGARCAHCRRRVDEHRGDDDDDEDMRCAVIYCQAVSVWFWAWLIAAAAYTTAVHHGDGAPGAATAGNIVACTLCIALREARLTVLAVREWLPKTHLHLRIAWGAIAFASSIGAAATSLLDGPQQLEYGFSLVALALLPDQVGWFRQTFIDGREYHLRWTLRSMPAATVAEIQGTCNRLMIIEPLCLVGSVMFLLLAMMRAAWATSASLGLFDYCGCLCCIACLDWFFIRPRQIEWRRGITPCGSPVPIVVAERWLPAPAISSPATNIPPSDAGVPIPSNDSEMMTRSELHGATEIFAVGQ